VGDRVSGKQLAFIGFNPRAQAPAIWLEEKEAGCQALLFRAAAAPPTAAAPSGEPEQPRGRVARAEVERNLHDPAASLRSVRVVPEQKDGVTVGLRLFGIRQGSLLGSVGIKNGDRLESINGFSLATPAKALEAYAHLVRAEQLRVHLVRAGAPLDLTLNID
jgi:general secretion pathway protein C